MLSFLKNWLGKTPTSAEVREQVKEESILPVVEGPVTPVADTTAQSRPAENAQTTALSLHESWEKAINTQEKYALSFMASELPPLETGHLSLAGINLVPHDEGIEVTAFVRNSSSHPVKLGTMTLLVLFGEDQLFTRQSFDLSEMGEIPPFHARPWSFVFEREHFLELDVLLANWKIAFEKAQKKLVLPQQLELEESWIQSLSEEQKNGLIRLAQQLPPLQPGEVNVQSVQVKKAEDGSLRVLLLIRNGSDKSLSFEKLPLVLLDATGEKVAEGLFELGGLTINEKTSKPWLFIFPEESIVKSEPDLSRWQVNVPQQ